MKIIQVDLNKDCSWAIQEAVEVLNAGGVVIYPTDTLYGLGANALNEEAVKKVFSIKERSLSKPLPILVKNMLWAENLAEITSPKKKILEKVWPVGEETDKDFSGKVTAVLPKKKIVPHILTAETWTVGVRIADYYLVDKLLGKFGYPLTSTSANISGEEPTNDIFQIVQRFKSQEHRPDLIIDAGILPKAEPSLIIDLTASSPKILRVGSSKPEQLMKLLEASGIK